MESSYLIINLSSGEKEINFFKENAFVKNESDLNPCEPEPLNNGRNIVEELCKLVLF